MDLGISGRRAIVSAGSAGLGLAVATALAAEGVSVAICGRDQARLDDALAAIGGSAYGFVADLSDPAAGATFVEAASDALGGCDILVANAGGPPAGTFASTDLDAYQYAFDLDCRSAISMCRSAIPKMVEQGWGRVVAVTSVGAMQPIPTLMASGVARAALTAFLKVTAREVASHGVTVNNLCPGFHTTGRLTSLYDGSGLEQLASTVPARTLGDPADFGAAAAFLCSEQARYITGTSLQIDGGTYAGLL